MNAIRRTAQEFAQMTSEYARRLQEDTSFRDIVGVLCGAPEHAHAFAGPRGVGISAFAAMLHLPTSTVRHYQRLGLITPYEVNGKFRFWFHNVAQAESVRQWRDLGLSLEEILEQRAQERIGGQTATFGANFADKSVNVLITSKNVLRGGAPAGDWQLYVERVSGEAKTALLGTAKSTGVLITARDVFPSSPADADDWRQAMARTLAEARAARSRLEARLNKLQEQLSRAQALEAALESHGRS